MDSESNNALGRPHQYRWLVFAVLCLSYLIIFSQRTAPGLIANQLQTEFSVSSAVLGTMASVQFFLYMVLQVPVGMFGDKFGPERLLVVGTLLDGVGTAVFGQAHAFDVLLLGRALVGAGDALIWVNIVLIVGRWFSGSEFGGVLGLVGTAGNLGAVFATIPFAGIIGAFGWRAPFTALGLLLILVAYLDICVLNRTLWPWRKAPVDQKQQTLSLGRVSIKETLGIVVRDKVAWAGFLCHFGVMGSYIGFTSLWAVPYFINAFGMTRAAASQFVLIGFVGAIFGGPLMGFISDKAGERRRPYAVLQAVVGLAWLSGFAVAGHPTRAVAYLMMLVLGFGCGGSLLTFASIRDVTPAVRGGATSGFANMGGFLSAVLLPILFGMVMDTVDPTSQAGAPAFQAYQIAFLVPTMFSLCGVIGSLMLPKPNDVVSSAPDIS